MASIIEETAEYQKGNRNGFAKKKYRDGTLETCMYVDGLRNGLCLVIDNKSKKNKSETYYINGIKNGLETVWKEDGIHFERQTMYVNGKKHGLEIMYRHVERIESVDGVINIRIPLEMTETYYENDIKHGTCIIKEDGYVKYYCQYIFDKKVGNEIVYENNKIVSLKTYNINGDLDGDCITYHDNGAVHHVYHYKNNLRHGYYCAKRPDGTVYEIAHYEYGNIHEIKSRYSN